MTKPEPKKRGPKPKPKVEASPAPVGEIPLDRTDEERAGDVSEADRARLQAKAFEAQVEAAANYDEPAQPEPALPLIDNADPAWARTAAVGARHVQYTAHDHITPTDVVHTLEAQTVTIPGHTEPLHIAARTITPPKLRPVRVTFTVRERINA